MEALPFVSFGDSDKVNVGEWVVAIGHPRDLSHTVTQGIISAKHRRGIMDPTTYQDFLQTDAAINPGNSGGPLLNLHGEVIGVNAAIASESGGFEGIGFAIPSNMVIHVANAIIKNGKVLRGWLGVATQDLDLAIAKSFGLDAERGAVIANVVKGGPADMAGLKRGDIVIAFDGKAIPDSGAFQNEVARTPIGKKVKVTVVRANREEKFSVKVGSRESLTRVITESLKERLGALIRRITTQEAEKFGLALEEGVAVDWVDPKGSFGIAGFERGDIILEVQGMPVGGVENFIETISSLPPNEKIVLLALDHRTGQTGYVQIIVR
jgi:serine protease Do